MGGNVSITPIFNQAKILHNAFEDVIYTVLIACLLVLGIALMFLGRLRHHPNSNCHHSGLPFGNRRFYQRNRTDRKHLYFTCHGHCGRTGGG